MTFREAQCRLLADLRHRIHNGDLTERGLARITGISQPHVHNVLKGVRFLSIGSFDAILKSLNYSILDFSTQPELTGSCARFQSHVTFELSMLDAPIGPGMPWPERATFRRRFSLPACLENIPRDLVLARVKFDPRMDLGHAGSDLALLDLSPGWRANIVPQGFYVVSITDETLLRYVRFGKSCVYLAASDNFDNPIDWDVIPRNGEIAALVKGRVIWLGRDEHPQPSRLQSGRFLVKATST